MTTNNMLAILFYITTTSNIIFCSNGNDDTPEILKYPVYVSSNITAPEKNRWTIESSQGSKETLNNQKSSLTPSLPYNLTPEEIENMKKNKLILIFCFLVILPIDR